MNTKSITGYLKEFGIRPSIQRIAIMGYLMTHHTHPTVDEIYNALQEEIPMLSKTTIYNTLKLFVEHGATQILSIDEKNLHFDGNITPHAHFKCKSCHKIFDIMDIENIPPISDEFEVCETQIFYYGYCHQCKQ